MGDSASLITVASGATQAMSQYESGKYNSKLAKYNAKVADLQAQQSLEQGESQAQNISLQTSQIEGQQVASAAGQGVVAGAGSQALITRDTENLSAMDQLMIRTNARRKALGYTIDAADSRNRAKLGEMQTQQAMIGTVLDTGARLQLHRARIAEDGG
jgi:hypothetical protein